MLVEEAGEILESHMQACIPISTQQLILIGKIIHLHLGIIFMPDNVFLHFMCEKCLKDLKVESSILLHFLCIITWYVSFVPL